MKKKAIFYGIYSVLSAYCVASTVTPDTTTQSPDTNSSDYSAFQQFDREYNIGFGVSQTMLQNGYNQLAGVTQQSIGLEVERLFDMGLWFDVDANIVISSLNNQVNGIGSGSSGSLLFNQDPNLGGLNVKVGYAFPLIPNYLMITPYGLAGRNTNLAASTVNDNSNQNITQDYYYTGGIGGRLEYRINNYVDVYADQLIAYNWDQSGPTNGTPAQNNMVYTSTLGAKFNVYKQLQLGVSGFYSFYQTEASLPNDPLTGTTVYALCNCGSYGGMVTVGLTY